MSANATIFERTQIAHSMLEAITVLYGQRPQYLKTPSVNNTWQPCVQTPESFEMFDNIGT